MAKFFLMLTLLWSSANLPASAATTLAQRLTGAILLQVEAHGEAWYVEPEALQRYYLGRPDDAFRIMRELGLGITNADLALIPESTSTATGSLTLRNRLKGRILLQVEAKGEAWYIYPNDLKRYYLGRPADAFALMRQLGLGISNVNLASIPLSPSSASPNGTSVIPPTQNGLLDEKDAARTLVLSHINAERSALGLPTIVLHTDLSNAAQMQADDMTTKGYTTSTSPSGKTISDWVEAAAYQPKSLAENIAQTNIEGVNLVMIWKEKSPASYQNAISTDYEHVGVGIGRVNSLDVYVVVFAKSFATYFAEQTVGLGDLNTVRSAMLTRVNDARLQAGLQPLVLQAQLNSAAQGHAQDMFDRAYYDHLNPEGLDAFQRIVAKGYQPQLTAENIAKNQFSVDEVMNSWLASPGHLANILTADFVDVGFGLAYGKNSAGYELLWVQNFGQPRE